MIFSVLPFVPPTIIASTVGSDGKTSSALSGLNLQKHQIYLDFFVKSMAFLSKSIAYTFLEFTCRHISTVMLPLPHPTSITE